MRACLKTAAILLFTSFALAVGVPAQEQKKCSKKKIYVKVGMVDTASLSLNFGKPYKSAEMWLREFMEFTVKVIKEKAGDDVEVIPWEERIKRDDDPSTPEEENAFIKPVPGNYEVRLEVGLWSIDDQTAEREFGASASLTDRDLNGNNLENFSWHRPDVFIAIRSAIDRMSGRGFSYLLEEYEKTHFHSLRDPVMKIEVQDPGFVSPEPDEQKVNVEVATKDCRERFGEGTNLWFPGKPERGRAIATKESEAWDEGEYWKARTKKDGKIEIEYTLMKGNDTQKVPIDVEIIGRGKKSIRQVVFIPVKTLKIEVEPEQKRVAPGDQTRIFVRLLKVDDKGTKEPVKGRTLTLKVTGLEDGTLEPKDKITTDENGLGTLTYTAGESDKTVRVEASYKPEKYETTFKGHGEISTGAYSCTVDLDFTSPFVPDRRMSIAALSMHVVFDKVVFEEGPDVDPFGGGVDVDAGDGVGTFTKFELNDVWGDDDSRHRPTFIKPPPKTFEAQLTMAIDEEQLKSPASDKTKKPAAPTTVKLVLRTWTGDITWGSELGSSADGNFSLEFEAPWANLIAGKPVTLKVPYKGESNLDEKGTWTITFASKKVEK